MDFAFSQEQEEFRRQVRDFLEAEITAGHFTPRCDAWIHGFDRGFSKRLASKGWLGLSLPKEYGGQGRTPLDRLVLTEELLRYGAPCGAHWFADRQVGPCVSSYGTEEQKRKYLPAICKAEMFFALGLSEPGAGSDLASLKTEARQEGDYYVINGQKVWTSSAHQLTHIYMVVRTDPTVPKHKGISEMIIDLSSPGVTVRPIVDPTGHGNFNEVFFDNVKVPADNLIGVKNGGWRQITAQLDYERSGIERLMGNYPLYQSILQRARQQQGTSPVMRSKLAELTVEFEVGRLLIYRVAWMLTSKQQVRHESAMAKLFATEFEQRLSSFGVTSLGLGGGLLEDSKQAPLNGLASSSYLFSPGLTLMAGTSEILRNVVAQRGLGLPAN